MNKPSHSDVLRFVWRYTRRHSWATVLIVLLSVLSTAFFLYQPFFYSTAIDAIAQAGGPDQDVLRFAMKQFAMGIGVAAIAFVFDQLGGILLGRMETRIMRDIYTEMFSAVQRHATGFHVSTFAGATSRKIGRGVDAVEGVLDRIFLNFLPAIILMVGFLVVLTILAPLISVIMLAGMVLYTGVALFLNFKLAKMYSWVDEHDSKVTGNLVDAISSNPLVKSFAAEKREDARHAGMVQEWERRQRRVWLFSTGVSFSQSLFLLVIELSISLLAVWLWYRGGFTPGNFIILLYYVGQLWSRLSEIGRNMRDYMRNVAHCEEMIGIALQPVGVKDRADARALSVPRGRVSFDHVGFRYEQGAEDIVDDFSLTIEPGEKIALVGHSGGGKSTLVKLIMRLYDVQRGSIMIDGQDIASVTQESLRSAIAVVPQDPILFHRSIAENIAYGKPDATPEEIERAATLAHAHEFISTLPLRYETLVGERGVKLSGGERQRVAIARAILADRPILVLDEATSSLDSQSEKYIQDALHTLLQGRTSIVIAHRLSTIKESNRILVIERGKIAEEGTHESLLKIPGGVYRNLYELQAGGFIGE